MKKSKLLLLLTAATLYIACSEKTDKTTIDHRQANLEKKSELNFEKDSLNYTLSLNTDEAKEFLILKKVYVQDSCFGRFNHESIKKALLYIDGKKITDEPYVKYFIKLREQSGFRILWTVRDFYNVTTYLELSKGETDKKHEVDLVNIKLHDQATGDWQAFNFLIKNGKWAVASKEKVTGKKYCSDTISDNINFSIDGETHPANEINFHNAFFEYPNAHYHCSETN